MDERGGAKAWVLAFVIAMPLSLGALIGIGCAIGANACPFGDAEAVTTTDGREIFQAQCAICHGSSGQGSSQNPNAPVLASGHAASLSLDELEAKIGNGRPFFGMPRFEGSLSPEQLRAVASYVVSLRGGS